MTGIIVKGIAGFYYVKAEDGRVYQCKARGIFKKDGVVPMIGDWVVITVQPDGDAVIDSIAPRKNEFIRPPISNVDMFVIVAAAHEPEPNLSIIDKFIVMAEKKHTEIAICINKADLAAQEELDAIKEIYENIYPVYCVSAIGFDDTDCEGCDIEEVIADKSLGCNKTAAKSKDDMQRLEKALAGKTAALAGPSGVGKSTILNRLQKSELMETGSVSAKTGRGRHTTRHAELFDTACGGMIFDTPGFTSFEVLEAEEDELQFLYPECADIIGSCRYDNCRHLKEPGCKVREAVSAGKIKKERYHSYVSQLIEIREREKNKYL